MTLENGLQNHSKRDLERRCTVLGCIESICTVAGKFCSVHRKLRLQEIGRLSAKRSERYVNPSGYVFVYNKEGKSVAEHRYIMETVLGRNLKKGESVHHKNGIRSDNRPENLELWVTAPRYGQRASDLVCPHCRKKYSEV